MGCRTEIAKVIIEQGADYVLALKGNQGDLHTDVVQLFTAARKQNFKPTFRTSTFTTHTSHEDSTV